MARSKRCSICGRTMAGEMTRMTYYEVCAVCTVTRYDSKHASTCIDMNLFHYFFVDIDDSSVRLNWVFGVIWNFSALNLIKYFIMWCMSKTRSDNSSTQTKYCWYTLHIQRWRMLCNFALIPMNIEWEIQRVVRPIRTCSLLMLITS